ncbi:MAG: HPr family phosphocarrier protein [Anaerolineales bacterium]|nr:HPr family phosphocarrier protein [Anaerolineales bacterium]MDW8162930.1 HPr family phosphocarrier protein [Anaerolineales bacterium]
MDDTINIIVTIQHSAGLHARPAAQFVKTASRFPCKISVRKVDSDKPPANAKSPLSILTLGVNQGDRVEIIAEGEQAQEAIEALVELVQSNFGEAVTTGS